MNCARFSVPGVPSTNHGICNIADQYTFRPTGSTIAALISQSLLHTVTQTLITNSYVIVIAMDYRKAFDTVRHVTLLEKMANLRLPDHVFNWLVNFFSERQQCTAYHDTTSVLQAISASIVQGSAVGPASYVVNASDLKAVTTGNVLCKYADDTYAISPSDSVHTTTAELDNVKAWADVNNLRLNLAKCAEIILYDSRRKRQPVQPLPLPNVPRVQSLKILGVTISNKLSVAEHVRNIIRSSAQTCHALRLLRAHGMVNASLQVVYRAIITAKLTYAASAWWGFTAEADRQRLEARKTYRLVFRRPSGTCVIWSYGHKVE